MKDTNNAPTITILNVMSSKVNEKIAEQKNKLLFSYYQYKQQNRKCRRCNSKYGTNKFCPNCGAPQIVWCDNCKTECGIDSNFCGNCSNQLINRK